MLRKMVEIYLNEIMNKNRINNEFLLEMRYIFFYLRNYRNNLE